MSNQTQNAQNLPTKPDWSKAPNWAKWFAINKNGMGFWFAKKPWKASIYWDSAGKEQNASDDFDPSNWEKSLQPYPTPTSFYASLKTMLDKDLGKPKIETLTVSLNTDISGYLAGKNSFITGLVDLLLARMAKEERFSGEVACEKSQVVILHDVITFKFDNDFGFAVVTQVLEGYVYVNYITQKHDDEWIPQNCFGIAPDYTVIRRINELEAVEFRTAMEAVYG